MSTDFIIFALPLPVLPTLRMPRRQKWMLAMVFSLGFLLVTFEGHSFLFDKDLMLTQRPIIAFALYRSSD